MALQQWQKILAAAGSAAGVAAALYCLFKEDEESADPRAGGVSASDGKSSKVDANDMSPEDVLQIINDLNEAQQKTKASMADITEKISGDGLEFPQIYELVKGAMPEDPLQARGLAPQDFEKLLMKNQTNEAVMAAFSKFSAVASQPGKELSIDTIVDIGKFISQEFDSFIADFQLIPDKAGFDMQVVLLVSQVVLNAKLKQKYDVTSEDYEGSMGAHQQQLMGNQAFVQNFMDYQQKMEAFMKASMR